QTVSDTTNAYNLFKEEVQGKATEIQNAHEQFKQDAKNTIAQIRAPYDELANNYQNTLFGELSNDQALSYFDKQASNVIQSGTWLAGIEMLNLQQLIEVGYEKDKFIGGQTIAFRMVRSQYSSESVPEPTTILGLAAIGLGFATGKLRKRHVLG
ncbi:MAG: PEP-CTERM sorting domain-containing protein, partial [Trichormus sp.]